MRSIENLRSTVDSYRDHACRLMQLSSIERSKRIHRHLVSLSISRIVYRFGLVYSRGQPALVLTKIWVTREQGMIRLARAIQHYQQVKVCQEDIC